LPPPAVLAGYDDVLPGAADRIISMAEKQMAHRQSLESLVVGSDVKRSWAGLIVGGVLALGLIVSGTFLIYHDHDTAGTTMVGTTLTAILGAFVYGTRARKEEREAKSAIVKKSKK